ncbi:MAG TPA: tetratricopeptide repeat protein [Kofleriaceae bacterium]|nr:tetratricopeptide repeat protein [Kofleriaceae bacterium]
MRASSTRWSFVAGLVTLMVFAFGLLHAPRARADAKSKADIEAKIKAAMENYDLLEYEEARKLLNQALTVAKKAKMDNEPITAKVHLSLGIVYFAGLGDAESAKLSFLNAVEIDPQIQIDKAYATPEMVKLLEDARAENPGGGTGDNGGGDNGGGSTANTPEPMDVDCATLSGMQHTIVENATGGTDLTMQAAVGADVQAAKVSIMYRPRDASEFIEAPMTLDNGCVYTGTIPASAMNKDLVHYYIAAYNAAGKVIASKGSAGSPNIVEVSAATGGGSQASDDDDEDPLAGGGHSANGNRGNHSSSSSDNTDVNVNKPVHGGSGKRTLFLAVAGGSGAGYVTGSTEQQANDVKCCFAPELLHVMPELGYYLSKTTSISIAVRLGFPVGANIPGHSPVAPAGVLRVRHSLSSTGNGLMVVGGIGGGVLRDTIKLDGAQAGMDTDVVALGPLLVNFGAGYNASLGAGVNLIAELNGLAGIPVSKKLGNSILNFGVQFDFNLGLVLGF